MSKSQNELLNAALAARRTAQRNVNGPISEPTDNNTLDNVNHNVEEAPAAPIVDDQPVAGPISDTKVKEDKKLHAKIEEVTKAPIGNDEPPKKQRKTHSQQTENVVLESGIEDVLSQVFSRVRVGTDRAIVYGPINELEQSNPEEIIEYITKAFNDHGIKVEVLTGPRPGKYRAIAIGV